MEDLAPEVYISHFLIVTITTQLVFETTVVMLVKGRYDSNI